MVAARGCRPGDTALARSSRARRADRRARSRASGAAVDDSRGRAPRARRHGSLLHPLSAGSRAGRPGRPARARPCRGRRHARGASCCHRNGSRRAGRAGRRAAGTRPSWPGCGRHGPPQRARLPRGNRARARGCDGVGHQRAGHRAPGGASHDTRRRVLRPHTRGGSVSAWSSVIGIVARDLTRTTRQTSRLLGGLVRPFMWLFLVGTGYNAIARLEGGLSYQAFVFPGVVVMAALFGAMLTAIATVYDREFGMLRLMLASPAGVPAVLTGRAVAAALVGAAQGLIVLACAPLVVSMTPNAFAAALGALVLAAASSAVLGLLVA